MAAVTEDELGSLECTRDGIRNTHHRACGGKGLLQVEGDKRFIFNDENMLASKHSRSFCFRRMSAALQ